MWAINPSQDHLEGVVNYLGSWVRDYFTDTPLALALDLPPSVPDRPVPAQWRHHVLMLVREICANAVKHSLASRINVVVSLNAEPDALSITIRIARAGGPGVPGEVGRQWNPKPARPCRGGRSPDSRDQQSGFWNRGCHGHTVAQGRSS